MKCLLPSPLHQLKWTAQKKETQQHTGMAPQNEGLQGEDPHLTVRGWWTTEGLEEAGMEEEDEPQREKASLRRVPPGTPAYKLIWQWRIFYVYTFSKFSLHELPPPPFPLEGKQPCPQCTTVLSSSISDFITQKTSFSVVLSNPRGGKSCLMLGASRPLFVYF